MTELLYFKNAYLKETWAKVLSVEGKKLLLERTIFFPESLDQESDTGRIDGIPLLGAIRQEDDIWHILAGEHKLKAGDSALLQLDWRKRHYTMRLHTAMHLLSDVSKKHFRIYPSNIRMADDAAHFEFSEEIGVHTIRQILERANRLISQGSDIDTYADAVSGGTSVRIGTFPEFSCEGLFVKNIKEIGNISLENAEMKEGKFILTVKIESNKIAMVST